MAKTKDVNMLHGPILGSIIAYTVPIILTNVLQLCFNTADLIVVGRFCGSLSVAAVGATSSLVHLIINLFIGLSIGCGIAAAQSIGASDKARTQRIVHTAVPVSAIIGIFLSIIGFFASGFMLKLMGTPADVLPLSDLYLKIYFIGILGTMVYNFCAAILRAAGDTKSPLTFLTISGVVNVILNLIFVILFDMDVAGVALATTISQYLSAILSVVALIKREDGCKLHLSKVKVYKKELFEFMSIGIPAGIQSSMFSFSNVILQSSVNSLGAVVVSGSAASLNIENFVYTAMNAFHQTVLNFTGQNIGIKNYKRARKVFKICLLCGMLTGAVLGALCIIFGKSLLGIYITDSDEAIAVGFTRLTIICLSYFIGGAMDVTTGAIRGMGISLQPMIITILGVCGIRILWVFTVFQIPAFHTVNMLYTAYPISWFATFVAEIITYYIVINKLQKKATQKE